MLCICVFVRSSQKGEERELYMSLYTVAVVLCIRLQMQLSVCSERCERYRERKSKIVFLFPIGGS